MRRPNMRGSFGIACTARIMKCANDFRPEGSTRSLGLVIDQDASNLASVQAGMQSAGYPGLWLSDQELRLRHFHKTISDYVGE